AWRLGGAARTGPSSRIRVLSTGEKTVPITRTRGPHDNRCFRFARESKDGIPTCDCGRHLSVTLDVEPYVAGLRACERSVRSHHNLEIRPVGRFEHFLGDISLCLRG